MSKDKTDQEMKRNSHSAFIPVDEGAAKSIANNMQKYGYDERFPILVVTDKATGETSIVDGWHRYKAAQIANVTPVYEEYEGNKIEEYVIRANIVRRQMASQRMVVSLLSQNSKLTTPELITMTGASAATVEKGSRMFKVLNPKQRGAVIAGLMSTKAAEREVKAKLGTLGTRNATPSTPPTLKAVTMARMVMCQNLEGITWKGAWEKAAENWCGFIENKHKNS